MAKKILINDDHDIEKIEEIIERWKCVRPDLDTSSTEIAGRLFRLEYFINRRETEALKPYRLNLGEFNALAALRRAGPPFELLPSQLQDTLLVSSGALTNRIDRLEAFGLVSRSPAPNDRRSVLVQLTREGLEIVDHAISDILATERKMIEPLSQDERGVLAQLLKKLLVSQDTFKKKGKR